MFNKFSGAAHIFSTNMSKYFKILKKNTES